MSRYIKKFGRVGHAPGPSEERGFATWAGYDIVARNRKEAMKDEKTPAGVPLEKIKIAAASLAQQLKASGSKPLPPDLRRRFIDVRAALFLRGVFDPVLVRFDSATVPQASTAELADELEAVAASL